MHNIIHVLSLMSAVFVSSCVSYQAWSKNPARVGEISPFSARVAKKMVEPIKEGNAPKKILEIGPGGGGISEKIISKLKAGDHLDLVEIEPVFCESLQKQFGHLPNVSVHCVDFLKWQPEYQYDHVISTLPLNSFSPELVQNLIDNMVHVTKNGATLAFVAYKWIRPFRMLMLNKEEKEAYKKNLAIVDKFYADYGLHTTDVYINLPPTIIYHLKITKDEEPIITSLVYP